MNKIKTLCLVAGALVSVLACEKQKVEVSSLTASFEISANPCYAGDEIHFTSTSTGGKKPYTYDWTVDGEKLEKHDEDVKYTFKTNGTYTVTLSLTDDLGNKASKKKLVVVDPAPVAKTGGLEVLWVGYMEGYNAITSPAIANDGSVWCSTRSNKLYKFDKNGKKVFDKEMFTAVNKGETYGTPSIDTDGTVFIGCGSKDKDGHFIAYNADGSVKWSFSQWYNASAGKEPEPAYQASIGGIGEKNVYFGCTGASGIAVSADKATGKRNGFAQPAGGCRTGLLLTKDGYVSWYGGNWGLWTIAQNTLDNGGDNKVNPAWGKWNSNKEQTFVKQAPMGGIAALTLNGKPCVAGVLTDQVGTRVYAVEAATGNIVVNHYVEDNGAVQDQGGVAITSEGYIVAALAFTTGQDDGGIVVIDPKTAGADGKCKVIGRYKVQEKVAGSPAVDAAGNIHFGTESGQYYVVDKNCNLLLKADIADAVMSKEAKTFEGLRMAKIWSSVVIGDDGVVYISFTDSDTRTFSGVIAFRPYDKSDNKFCKGPAASEWPMFGHDRRHTNRQI